MKPELTIDLLIKEAKEFCTAESKYDNPDLFGVTDGKAGEPSSNINFKNG